MCAREETLLHTFVFLHVSRTFPSRTIYIINDTTINLLLMQLVNVVQILWSENRYSMLHMAIACLYFSLHSLPFVACFAKYTLFYAQISTKEIFQKHIIYHKINSTISLRFLLTFGINSDIFVTKFVCKNKPTRCIKCENEPTRHIPKIHN